MRIICGLIALCVAACGLTGICHWTACAAVTATIAAGLCARRAMMPKNAPVAGQIPEEDIPDARARTFRRVAAALCAVLFAALCAGDAARGADIRESFMSAFLNLIWALLAYRSMCCGKLSERMQAAVLILLPMAGLSLAMPAAEYALFLFVCLAALFAFFAQQSAEKPGGGAAAAVGAGADAPNMHDAGNKDGIARGRRRRAAVSIGLAAVGASFLAGVLFLVMPRVRGGDAAQAPGAAAAFPDVSLGKTGKIDLDPTLVFRSNVPKTDGARYWRIDAQNAFDGTVWRNTQAYRAREIAEAVGAPVYRVEFIRDWHDVRLPILGHATGVRRIPGDRSRARFYADGFGNYRRRGWPPAVSGFEFSFDADASAGGAESGEDDFADAGAIAVWPARQPDSPSYRRLRQLALRIAGDARTAKEKAEKISDFLKNNYAYSLDRPKRSGFAVEDFLFDRKYGHCEMFSSAMAVLLATIGVGARNVTGFASSEYRDGYNLVRVAHAHSWVEVRLDGGRWETFDPTPPGAAQFDPDWRARLNDWFDTYRSDALYRAVAENPAAAMSILIAIAAAICIAIGAVRAVCLCMKPTRAVMKQAWQTFAGAAEKKIKNGAADIPRAGLESWYERFGAQDSEIGRFVRENVAVRFMSDAPEPSGFSRLRANRAALRSMRLALAELKRR